MNEHREQCEKRGIKAEEEFAKLLIKPVAASRDENIYEHWDLKDINGDTYDVKAMKQYRSSDNEATDRLHWIEFQNVDGNTGWLYGGADYIAFETRKWWIVVSRKDLVAFVEGATRDGKKAQGKPKPYEIYQRNGRNDRLTILPTVDLLSIASQVLVKK